MSSQLFHMCNYVTIVFLNQCLQKENQEGEASVGSVPGLVYKGDPSGQTHGFVPWSEHDYFLHHKETN